MGPNFYYPIPLCMILFQDFDANEYDDFILNRLGYWRRSVHTRRPNYFSLAFLPNIDFERIPIIVSQLRTFPPYSGAPVKIMFEDQETKQLVGEIILAGVDGTLSVKSGTEAKLECTGGAITIQHSCVECDKGRGQGLHFGFRGPNSDPWCGFSVQRAPDISDPSFLKYYQEADLLNARARIRSSVLLPCHQRMSGKIQFSEQEDCFIIGMTKPLPSSLT
jgi:hypothetical protein